MEKFMRNEGSALPEEIIYEILLRLPAKSLGKFKRVSKLWLSTISDPQFITSHLDLSRARPKLLITLPKFIDGSRVDVLLYSADYPGPGNEVMEQDDEPQQTLMAKFHGFVLKGDNDDNYYTWASRASGGLVSFGFQSEVIICNPVTGETINHRPPRAQSFVRNHFGYDPIEKKYKVLTTCLDHDGQYCGSFVITLGEEGWRMLEYYHPTVHHGFYHDDALRSAGVCINGVIYYVSYSKEDVRGWGYFHLAAFDLHSETFQVIPLPDKNFDDTMLFLKESAGWSVAVFRLPHNVEDCYEDYEDYNEESDVYNEVEVYTLKDKDLGSWSYECFPVPEEWSEIVVDNNLAGTSHKGELLFVPSIDFGEFNLYLYDAETGNMRCTKVQGLHEYGYEVENWTSSFIRVGHQMETLKSLKVGL